MVTYDKKKKKTWGNCRGTASSILLSTSQIYKKKINPNIFKILEIFKILIK